MSETAAISNCARCGADAPRLIDELCPSCLARNVRSGMESLLAPAEPDDLAPEIPGIDIKEPLGAGGMGLVFRGVREADGEALAVKVLPRILSADPEWRERFHREATMLAALDHPHIVKILGNGETLDGRLYLAMELVEGCDLRRLLRAGKLDPARAIDIASKVAAALAHAHQRGVVHRDIKPGNILVGDGGIVKVADFGIARATTGTASSFTMTQTREAFGTPYYIAPEVVANASAASPASDVYALGVMLYEMLTGHVPMGHFTPASRETKLDRSVDRFITSALADNPAERMAGMEEVQQSLTALRRQLDRKVAGRRWRIAAAIAAALAISVGASVWFTRRSMQVTAPHFPHPSMATVQQPWGNSLGMKFVPVSGTTVLFSILETRRGDFAAFKEETGLQDFEEGFTASPIKMGSVRGGKETFEDGTWRDPGFPQTPEHPVVGIGLLSANQFCRWLTTREHTLGRLPRNYRYRLPTSEEWDAAWNAGPRGDGNTPGTEVLADGWPANLAHGDKSDPFPRTAPVGSFPPNAAGLFDLYGNVMEGCVNFAPAPQGEARVNYVATISARGGSWRDADIRPSYGTEIRAQMRPFFRRSDLGFRVVLSGEDAAVTKPAE